MTLKEKLDDLFKKYVWISYSLDKFHAKKCMSICVKNEYNSNRELLFNLKSSGIEISEKLYLSRLQGLIDEEKLLIEEIQKL